MSIEDFKMYEQWNREREIEVRREPVVRPRPMVLASWGSRVGAYLIDSILLGIPMLFFIWDQMRPVMASLSQPGAVDPITGQTDPELLRNTIAGTAGMQLKFSLVSVLLATVYYVVCHGSMGQSLGKMLVGIKLVRADGANPTFTDALKRALVHPVAGIIPIAGGLVILVNGLWPLWDDNKQSLGDKVARTQVVRV